MSHQCGLQVRGQGYCSLLTFSFLVEKYKKWIHGASSSIREEKSASMSARLLAAYCVKFKNFFRVWRLLAALISSLIEKFLSSFLSVEVVYEMDLSSRSNSLLETDKIVLNKNQLHIRKSSLSPTNVADLGYCQGTVCTVWKSKKFSIIQIFREINFDDFWVGKTAILHF